MTADEVAAAAGLQPRSFFEPHRRFAEEYGCEPRRTGRTTWALCEAVSAALDGKTVLVQAASYAYAAQLKNQAVALIGKVRHAHLRAGVPVDGWLFARHNHTELRLQNGGSIDFASRKASPCPTRIDVNLSDHFDPTAPRPNRACAHRLERAKRRCAACGLKLRKRALIKVARARQGMKEARPDLFEALGIAQREALHRAFDFSKDPPPKPEGVRFNFTDVPVEHA